MQPSRTGPIITRGHINFKLVPPPIVPTIAPGNVQAEAINSTTIRFTWAAPNPQFINGINQGYKVDPPTPTPPQRYQASCRGRWRENSYTMWPLSSSFSPKTLASLP